MENYTSKTTQTPIDIIFVLTVIPSFYENSLIVGISTNSNVLTFNYK